MIPVFQGIWVCIARNFGWLWFILEANREEAGKMELLGNPV
jgi:hypothetical protein